MEREFAQVIFYQSEVGCLCSYLWEIAFYVNGISA